MTSRFQDLVQQASRVRRPPKVSTAGLFVGMETETNLWGQKDNRYKPDEPAAEPEPSLDAPDIAEAVVDEDQIIAELALTDDLTVTELKAIRRAFARKNHPDTSQGDPALCESRMKIANMIIDEQIRLRSQT